jgi:hypothetical protein
MFLTIIKKRIIEHLLIFEKANIFSFNLSANYYSSGISPCLKLRKIREKDTGGPGDYSLAIMTVKDTPAGQRVRTGEHVINAQSSKDM